MLGSVNANSEYSFTQIDDSNSSVSRVSDLMSNRIGKIGADKKDPLHPLEKNKDENADRLNRKKDDENVVPFEDKTKEDKTKEIAEENEHILEELREKKEPVDLFSDEEGSVSLGIAYGSDLSSLTRSFKSLAASVGSNDDRVTKSQLFSLLQNLSAKGAGNQEFKEEITFVKNLLAKFDTISEGLGYITSFNGVNDIQDYRTVTKEQVTPPIDLRI